MTQPGKQAADCAQVPRRKSGQETARRDRKRRALDEDEEEDSWSEYSDSLGIEEGVEEEEEGMSKGLRERDHGVDDGYNDDEERTAGNEDSDNNLLRDAGVYTCIHTYM